MHWRVWALSALAALTLLTGVFCGGGSGERGQPGGSVTVRQGSVSVSPSEIAIGDVLEITGDGWMPGQPVSIGVYFGESIGSSKLDGSTVVIATATVDASGEFATTFRLEATFRTQDQTILPVEVGTDLRLFAEQDGRGKSGPIVRVVGE